jgi:hypothetical protein
MNVARCVGWFLLPLVTGACASHSSEVAKPAPSFASTADALSCARNALADVGFHVETRMEAPPGQRSIAAAVERPTSVTARIASDQQIDYVRAAAHLRKGSPADSAATLTVSAGTIIPEEGSSAWTWRALSSIALRGRDAVVAQCHAKIDQTYPGNS